jgi:hypothetical protein
VPAAIARKLSRALVSKVRLGIPSARNVTIDNPASDPVPTTESKP